MQLSKIKMSGFKSFVDPTTIPLPSHLIAIVGPNGCGKSNIIDAVTWVMGESSPKYLRGEASTDVIFNGSNSRKPIGQASVELVFDNSDGTIGDEYAKFAEIAIKRVINRESESLYYLNGVRCRKRDVVDIFLGTGLGPRSYSIIGQNMINRIIEAKPDELRSYLEEAAGISKYKERRHETELRIHQTQENLARINDLYIELEKQLSHLKHQATVAEKFKTLKQQERVLRAEWYAIQWRQLDSKMVNDTLEIQREETALEARNSELSKTDREIEQLRHEQRVAHDAFQEVQRRYYSVGNEITRIEQDILHHQERQQQWETDLAQTQSDWQAVRNQMTEAEETLHKLDTEIERIEPEQSLAVSDVKGAQENLHLAEESLQEWQANWDEFNQIASKTAECMQVEKTHITHLEERFSSLQKYRTQLGHEQEKFNFTALDQEIESFSQKSYEIADKLEHFTNQLKDVRHEIASLNDVQHDAHTRLDTVRSELQRLRGQEASLSALQQTALGQRDNPATPWLKEHQLNENRRLAQAIEVAKGWELAVEKVLGFALQAICIEDRNEIIKNISQLEAGNVCLFTTRQVKESKKETEKTKNKQKGVLLLQKVESSWPLDSLLSRIYAADSLEDALAICESLNEDESVITQDGIWLNPSWLKIFRAEDQAAGVFQKEQELKQLANQIEHLQSTQKELEKNIAERREKIKKLEEEQDNTQSAYNQHQAQAAQINAQLKMKQERLADLKKQSEHFIREFEICAKQLKQTETDLLQSRSRAKEAEEDAKKQVKEREVLLEKREQARHRLQKAKESNEKKQALIHELEIRLQSSKSQKISLQQNITQMNTHLSSLNDRKITLQSELASMPPMETLKKSLSRVLDKHVSVDVELNTAKIAMESLDQEFRSLEERRQIIERDINKVRHNLELLRVEWQGWKVKNDTIREQIKETEFKLEDVLRDLPQDITAEEWQGKLEQVVQRINRLGPINLIAIDEYKTCMERKEYLEQQLNDLRSGLATLEEAIAKIDRETRSRFKETFDQVNDQFQKLFPTVFGGGKAYLELTSEDLLAAGVTTMACPPGKRNSSIYLLSGGEKSLTAIALIFSIFYLNPAPFCLLDEVDAALDETNVLHFTRLVKSMAEKTQFIFISHNKITIEMADHLIGVTMNEPGVSRLVSVDIEKAMTLATEHTPEST